MLEKKLAFTFSDTQKVLQIIAAIDRFHGKWEQAERLEGRYLKELKKVATLQSIGSSTRIEGSQLSDREVEKLLSKVKITKFETRDQEEVVGYYDALEAILENHSEIPLKESSVLHLHGILLNHSGKDERHRGKYKSLPNSVNATYPDGRKKTIFETTSPHLVRKEMEALIAWTQDQIQLKKIHPLLIVSLFVYEFLSIHPFQDGNGRLSRLLSTLLLLRLGYGFIQFISFEHQIENRKAGYYRALMNCQRQRQRAHMEDISEWVLFFLGNLLELAGKLERKYAGFRETGGYINDRQKRVLEFIRENRPAKLADIKRKFPDTSVNTLKKDLQRLVSETHLEKSGDRKGAVYSPRESPGPPESIL